MPNPILMRRMGGRAVRADLCAVNELATSELILAGGGDTFDCYLDKDSFEGTSTGSGFAGVWIEGNQPFQYPYGDDFDAYADSDSPENLGQGTGFAGDWILAPPNEVEWELTEQWPVWWLEADAITGLADNTQITTWPDKAGVMDATQATAARRPIYRTGIVNGLPVARLSSTHWMQGARVEVLRSKRSATVVHVFQASTVADAGFSRILFTATTPAGGGRATVAPLTPGDGNFGLGAGGRRLDADGFMAVQNPIPLDLNWHISVAVFNWEEAKLRLWLDGVLVASRDDFQTAGLTSDTNSTFVYFGSPTAGAGFEGDFALLQVFLQAFSDSEVAAVTAHFQTKYGL